MNLLYLLLIFSTFVITLRFAYKKGLETQHFEKDYKELELKIKNCTHYPSLKNLEKEIPILYHKYSGYERSIDKLQRILLNSIENNKPRVY